MKKSHLLPLLALALLALFQACKFKPDPPEVSNISKDEQSMKEYISSEYSYTEKWLSQYNSLRTIIREELRSRSFKLPPAANTKSDTAVMEGGRWRVYVHERKEIRAQSGGRLKTVYRLVTSSNDSVLIEDFLVVNLQCLVLVLSNNLSTSIEIIDIFTDKKTGAENKINFPEPEGRITGLTYDKENDRLQFVYSSCVTPPTCYAYGIHSMRLGILWKSKVRSFDREDYKAEKLFITGSDGKKTAVSLVKKTDGTQTDNPAHMALFVDYRSKEETSNSFSPAMLSLLNRGFILMRLHIPEADSGIKNGNSLISAVIKSIVDKNISPLGNITLWASDEAAPAALLCAKEHPGWIKTLVLENPPLMDPLGTLSVPYCLAFSAFNNSKSESAITGFVKEYRKGEKPDNTFLISKGKNQKKDGAYLGDLITFILASYDIDK